MVYSVASSIVLYAGLQGNDTTPPAGPAWKAEIGPRLEAYSSTKAPFWTLYGKRSPKATSDHLEATTRA